MPEPRQGAGFQFYFDFQTDNYLLRRLQAAIKPAPASKLRTVGSGTGPDASVVPDMFICPPADRLIVVMLVSEYGPALRTQGTEFEPLNDSVVSGEVLKKTRFAVDTV